tara:strand:- start:255 stop:893 length:639 start_codon:yes stop_codon:yes gene_type:complete
MPLVLPEPPLVHNNISVGVLASPHVDVSELVFHSEETNQWRLSKQSEVLIFEYDGSSKAVWEPSGALATSGQIRCPSMLQSSDDRIKHNERDITGAVKILRKLKPQVYDKSETIPTLERPLETMTTFREAGFIAQHVEDIEDLRPFVQTPEDTEQTKAIDYNSLFVYAVAAIKELDIAVDKQARRIANLESVEFRLGTSDFGDSLPTYATGS